MGGASLLDMSLFCRHPVCAANSTANLSDIPHPLLAGPQRRPSPDTRNPADTWHRPSPSYPAPAWPNVYGTGQPYTALADGLHGVAPLQTVPIGQRMDDPRLKQQAPYPNNRMGGPATQAIGIPSAAQVRALILYMCAHEHKTHWGRLQVHSHRLHVHEQCVW